MIKPQTLAEQKSELLVWALITYGEAGAERFLGILIERCKLGGLANFDHAEMENLMRPYETAEFKAMKGKGALPTVIFH